MNFYALIIGIAVALSVVIWFQKTRLERKQWVYPLLLVTFPMYYWVFAVYASDYKALYSEIAVGVIFLVVAFIAYKLNSKAGLLILSLGYIAHAIYDGIHNTFFYNSGAPTWWPEFCGAVDVLMGAYIAYLAIVHHSIQTRSS